MRMYDAEFKNYATGGKISINPSNIVFYMPHEAGGTVIKCVGCDTIRVDEEYKVVRDELEMSRQRLAQIKT